MILDCPRPAIIFWGDQTRYQLYKRGYSVSGSAAPQVYRRSFLNDGPRS